MYARKWESKWKNCEETTGISHGRYLHKVQRLQQNIIIDDSQIRLVVSDATSKTRVEVIITGCGAIAGNHPESRYRRDESPAEGNA